jgi:hypothetical protein
MQNIKTPYLCTVDSNNSIAEEDKIINPLPIKE